ncbi:MAG: hypothetical protein AB8B87_10470 [Granulosicoccus sp.]
MQMIWGGLDADIDGIDDGIHNHFTVIEGLKDPNSALVWEILKVI